MAAEERDPNTPRGEDPAEATPQDQPDGAACASEPLLSAQAKLRGVITLGGRPGHCVLPADAPLASAAGAPLDSIAAGILARTDITVGADGIPRTNDGTALKLKDQRMRVVSIQIAPCYETPDHRVVAQISTGPDEKTRFWSLYLRDEDRTARCFCDVELPNLNDARRCAESLALDTAKRLTERLREAFAQARESDPTISEPPPVFVEAYLWERKPGRALAGQQPPIENIDTGLPPAKEEKWVARMRAETRSAAERARVF